MALFKQKYSVKLGRFDGGLNTTVSPILGDLTQSPELNNVVFDDFGAVKTRLGTTSNVSLTGSSPIYHMYGYINNSKSHIVCIYGEGLFNGYRVVSGVASYITDYCSMPITDYEKPIGDVMMHGNLFLSNGKPHSAGVEFNSIKYNGDVFTRWGVVVPSAPASVNTHFEINLVSGGYYRYVIYGITSSGARGDYSSATTDIETPDGRNIIIRGIPGFNKGYGIDKIGIARNTAGASGLFWKVAEVTNGVSVYTDHFFDSQLTEEAEEDRGDVPGFTVCASFLGRIFGASTERSTSNEQTYLYYSEVNEPEVFPTTNIIRIGEGDGAPIRSIGVFSTGLVIGKDDGTGRGSLWFLYMPTTTVTDWKLKKINTPHGAIGPSIMPNFGNMLAYVNKYGIFDINESELDLYKADAASFEISSEISGLNSENINNICAVNFNNRAYFAVPYGTGQATNNMVLVYDYVKGRGLVSRKYAAWSKYEDYDMQTIIEHGGNLYGGSAFNGMVYQLETGNTDNGTAIDSSYSTMAIRGKKEHHSNVKLWRYAIITLETSGAWNMEVDYTTLDSENIKTEIVDMSTNIGVWDDAVFGVNHWGDETEKKKVKVVFSNALGTMLRLRFRTNGVNHRFKIYDVEAYYNLKGIRE